MSNQEKTNRFPFVLVSDKLLKILSPFRATRGLTFWPFIIVSASKYKRHIIKNRQLLAYQQQIELLIVGYLVVYALTFIKGLIKNRNFQKAIDSVPFNKEQIANEKKYSWKGTRKMYSWIKYL